MVTPAGSRPAALSQRQVDDLARGRHAEAAKLLHADRRAPPAAESRAPASGPVPVAAEEMQAVVRSGAAPAGVVQRIAAAAGAGKGEAKAVPASEPGKGAPALKPWGTPSRS